MFHSKLALLAGCLALPLALSVPKASAVTYKTIDIAGATETDANDINTANTIVGFYLDSAGLGHGFSMTAGGQVTKLNVPGASDTRAYGINDKNQIVGWYTDSSGITHGFLFNQGRYNKIDPPGSTLTNAWSISDDGSTIVGAYTTSDGVFHGFTRRNGTYTTYDAPNGATLTELLGINKTGIMVGIYIDSNAVQHGFTLAQGQFTDVTYPATGVVVTATDRINDTNEIVGLWGTNVAGPFSGYRRIGTRYSPVNFPNSTETRCRGLNNAGDITGRYTDAGGVIHGMLVLP